MLPADAVVLPATAAGQPRPAWLSGWGRGRPVPASLLEPADDLALAAAVDAGRHVIARGMGRSYGDAAHLTGGLVVRTTRLKGVILDAEQGCVDAAAGVTLRELLARFVPAGWMVPVVPGTQHVTVGGAIASDIHGKNHGTAGTFGRYVERLRLLTAGGELLDLVPGDELFEATVGGMGLTGVIVSARIRMRRVSSALLSVDTDKVDDLEGALAALSAPGGAHRVAWLDLLCARPGRGVVTRAEHVDSSDSGSATVAARATVPSFWPGGVLRPGIVRLFNELRFRALPRRRRGQVQGIGEHMFPLDGVAEWPRLYGPRGFLQYQLVVPPGSERVLSQVIELLRRRRIPCYLAVLKDFGPAGSPPLSFPIRGWTLALDLPCAVPGLGPALAQCDELVVQAGGRVYLTKDARLEPEIVAAMYPRLAEWRMVRDRFDPDGRWRSDLGVRTGLVAR